MAKYDKLTKTIWKGYERHDFLFDGREVIVVLPKVTAKGNPWVWRAEFFDSFPSVDMALLEKGWHLLYYRISDMYGCPESIKTREEIQGIWRQHKDDSQGGSGTPST